MQEGDVVLASIPQANGIAKNRPIIVLREMPPFGDLLVCGVSTQLRQRVDGFDDVIAVGDADFPASGLLSTSLIRLGFIAVLPRTSIPGVIGSISPARHRRLLDRLSDYLVGR